MSQDLPSEPATLIEQLKVILPHWSFSPYGLQGAVACFPPSPRMSVEQDIYHELNHYCPISSVCGPFLVVTCFWEKRRCPGCGCIERMQWYSLCKDCRQHPGPEPQPDHIKYAENPPL